MSKDINEKLAEGREYRYLSSIEVREAEPDAEQAEQRQVVSGYATTYNQEYLLWDDGDVRVMESVTPTAFDEADMSDVIMQYNHEGRVFARTKNGSLQLDSDDHGLKVTADLTETEIGRQLYEEIKGGYTDKMSFGFTVAADEWTTEDAGDNKFVEHRTITKIGKLFDVSAVSIPANDYTEISARSALASGVDERVRAEMERLRSTECSVESAESITETAEVEVREMEAEELRKMPDTEEVRAEMIERETRKADREAVANGAGMASENKTMNLEDRKAMTDMEIRKSAEYMGAYANYIKTGREEELRTAYAQMTEDATNGHLPVPYIVDETIKHAWENDAIMSQVRKSYLRGALKVGFEISSDGAVTHTEGAAAPSMEDLVTGIRTLTPVSVKKWIKISDEAMDLEGEAFLRYIYEEIANKIAHKVADLLIADILACGTQSTATKPGVRKVQDNPAVDTIAKAMAQLSDEATTPVVIMNKATWADFKAAQYGANYAVDPFEGLTVLFNNSLPAFSAATTGVGYAIVGDLGEGALANFPNGEEITMKMDDLSLAEADMIKVIGREYVGVGVVAPYAFVTLTHEA